MRKVVIICLLGLLFSLKTSAQDTCNCNVTADQLMLLVVNKARQNDNLKRAHLIYSEDYTLEEFDYAGVKKPTTKKTNIISGQVRKLAGFDLSIGELLQLLVTRDKFSFADPAEIIEDSKKYLEVRFSPKENLESTTTEDNAGVAFFTTEGVVSFPPPSTAVTT